MSSFYGAWGRIVCLALAVCVSLCTASGQGTGGSLRGQVLDEFGGAIIGATVSVTGPDGATKTTTTGNDGTYVFTNLAPGQYSVRASAAGFAIFENPSVAVSPARRDPLNITLKVTIEEQKVTVSAESQAVSTDPENNASRVVLTGKDLESLPDDPDELAAALQALAGPSAGPNGGQFFIDGFSDGRLPPKESIREIRINQNPFSAEFDRLGYGRVEIFTKPGSDRIRGQASFAFKNQALDARNPFAVQTAPFRATRYGGNLSGPIIAKKSSYFLDFERRDINDNAIINATILDPALNIVPFTQIVLQPQQRTTFSPRVDWQLNPSNTLVARYSFMRSTVQNSSVGGFSLASRGFTTASTEHTAHITETDVINPKVLNETRFQFIRRRTNQQGDNSIPAINVLESFVGGGAQVGTGFVDENRYELQNLTSFSLGAQALKVGVRFRAVKILNSSPSNFGGTFTFQGGVGPQLNANNQVVTDANGQPILIPITSIERYRRTLLFQSQGLSAAQVRALGGGATQFTIAGGNPLAGVTQLDVGPFIQDDWRVRPNLTLNLGLRYEAQTNIKSSFDFAPRLGFAYSPGAGGTKPPKTVIRGGSGIFFDRISESLTLQSNRFNGANEQQFIIPNPDFFGVNPLPTFATLQGLAIAQLGQTVWRLDPNLKAPYTIQTSLSVERQLPYNIVLTVTYINAHSLHLLRARNINAPFLGNVAPGLQGTGVRPIPNGGNIFEYESSGVLNQNQMIVFLRTRLTPKLSIFANYTLNKAMSNTDGAGSFPAYTYDLSTEYGPSAIDIRHRFFLFGSYTGPWGVTISPLIFAHSGAPFNITTGRDINGDSLFTERPAFAVDPTRPGVIVTRFGAFDPNPIIGEQIIPRNFGRGPAYFSINLRLNKTFGFGEVANAGGAGGAQRGSGGRGQGGGGGGGRRGGGGPFGGMGGPGGATEKKYNLTVGVFITNLFNHTNTGTPIGNLSSPLFGVSNSLAAPFGFGGPGGGGISSNAGNRQVELQLRFSF